MATANPVYNPPSGGSSVSIGSAITGTGGNNRVLGIDGSGNLKDFGDLQWNDTTKSFTVSKSGGAMFNIDGASDGLATFTRRETGSSTVIQFGNLTHAAGGGLGVFSASGSLPDRASFTANTGKGFGVRVDLGTDSMIYETNGRVYLAQQAAYLGGAVQTIQTAVGNVGGGEDTLGTHSTVANTLVQTGDVFGAVWWVKFAANATDKTLRVKWAGSTVHTIGPGAQNSGFGVIMAEVARDAGATAQKIRVTCQFSPSGVFTDDLDEYDIAGTTSADVNALAITSESGAGAANNDVQLMPGSFWFFRPNG